jgi:hypothetical protein
VAKEPYFLCLSRFWKIAPTPFRHFSASPPIL